MGNPNASEAELFAALETAQAAEIVRTKPNGIDEPVLRGGSNFSGGQNKGCPLRAPLFTAEEF